jgi:hydrogenase maturation protein HypF
LPPPACIEHLEQAPVGERPSDDFVIIDSQLEGDTTAVLPADLRTCEACSGDVARAGARHHRYPFTSCSRCGPRYAIARALPYDRANTTMQGFAMCDDCSREYDDLSDRRYHAQPIACPACGPELALYPSEGQPSCRGDAALRAAAEAIVAGDVVAVRGLGGFQLLVDATNAAAVERLRVRKHRPHRAFAVMFPNVASLSASCRLDDAERALFDGPAAPIVLLRATSDAAVVSAVAPESPWVGALLPYTPLHALLLDAVARPCVCTSGNLSDEPMCIELDEARAHLAGVADLWLSHDRPIARPLDDSVARVIEGGPQLLRRARGYAPLPVARVPPGRDVLALGAQLKSSAALAKAGRVILGQHIGDLDSPAAQDRLTDSAEDLCRFFDAHPRRVACDMHPDYASTRIAERLAKRFGAELVRVQHHHAHVAACVAEHGITGEVLGLAWDGTGYGPDGTVWGGEALRCRGASFERFGHLRCFALPGGDRAARAPWRSALGWLLAAGADPGPLERWRPRAELERLAAAVERGVNAPLCSSAGRLFDAVAALAGVADECSYEGQAAMMLEALAMKVMHPSAPYALPLVSREGVWIADTTVLLGEVLDDLARGTEAPIVARRFHEALVALGVELAERAGSASVVLTGGCFQNRLLHEGLVARLSRAGHSVYTARAVPPTDGGIAVGQIFVAAVGD